MPYQVKLDFMTPWRVGSGMGLGKLIDLRVVRDKDDMIYVPATTLKGVLRSAAQKIASIEWQYFDSITPCKGKISDVICKDNPVCIICRMFGSPYREAKLRFQDLYLDTDMDLAFKNSQVTLDDMRVWPAEVKASTKISRIFRTVSHGQLFTLETAPKWMSLSGEIENLDDLEPEEEELLLLSAKFVTHLGGTKSRGLGRANLRIEKQE